jgi:transcriptional antiterminator
LELVEEELSSNGIKRSAENGNLYDRLMIHLTYLINRLQTNQQDETSLINMEEFVKSDYPQAYQIGQAIYDVIEKELDIDLSRSERVYLVIHIQRLLK